MLFEKNKALFKDRSDYAGAPGESYNNTEFNAGDVLKIPKFVDLKEAVSGFFRRIF